MRAIWVGVLAVLLLAGCSGDDDSDPPLATELLAVGDLPAGWRETGSRPDDGIDCLDHDATAEAGFRSDDRALVETLTSSAEEPAVQESYSMFVSSVAQCLPEISFPRLGTESSAFGPADGSLTVLIARKADRLLYLAYRGGGSDELEPLARVALDKVLG